MEPTGRLDDLRKRAEHHIRRVDLTTLEAKSAEEVKQLVHELQVYQVELEMQHEELRAAKWALEESEAKYRHLYQFAPNAYFTLNMQGAIEESNFAAAQLLGVERRLLQGQLLRRFVSAHSREAFDYFFMNLLSATPQRCEVQLFGAKQTVLTVLLEGAGLIYEEKPTGRYLITVVDITERQWAEQQRQEEHRRLKDAQALGRLGNFEWPLPGEAIHWSDELYRIHGLLPQSEPITKDAWLVFVHPDDREATRQAIRQTRETGTPLSQVQQIIQRNGTICYVHCRAERISNALGTPLKLYGTVQDITEQVEAEQKLRASESLLRAAEAVGHTGSYEGDLVTGRFRFSDEMFRIFGYAPQAFEPTLDFVESISDPADAASIRKVLEEAVRDKKTYQYLRRIYRPDRQMRYVLGHGEVIHDQAGNAVKILGIARDITEQKQAEDALYESRNLLEAIFNASLAGIAVFESERDAAGNLVDFVYRLANPAVETLAGRKLPGCRYAELFPEIRTSGIFDQLKAVVETGQPTDFEHYYTGEGFAHWFRITAVKLGDGLVSSVEDITGRKRSEDALHQSWEHLYQVLNALPQMTWTYLPGAGINFYNARCYAYTGLSVEQMRAHGWAAVVHSDDRAATMDVLNQSAVNPANAELENRYRRYDGTYRWHLNQVAPLRNERGDTILWVGTATDIHDRKRAEAQVREMEISRQKELSHAILAAQEEEKRRLSEALHNGLAQYLYAVRLRLEGVKLERLPEAFDEVKAAKDKAEALLLESIKQARDLSHELTPAMLEEFGLQEAIEEFCGNLSQPNLRLHCTVETFDPPLSKSLEVAAYRISQELANNILKHAKASQASLDIGKDGDWLNIRAQDNGKGFDPGKIQKKAFGLQAIRNRVQLLGGTLDIQSNAGAGTTILICLPLVS